MKTVTMYEADDGKQFRYEDQCRQHEEECTNLAAANDMLDNGATLMAALTRYHQTHPWWDSNLTVEDKVILMHTTKDTGFVVSHWQCSNRPGYKPCGIDLAGRVQLWGDVGCWSGSYGNWCSLDDVLRYARQTRRDASSNV